jgi:hypothetical protein
MNLLTNVFDLWIFTRSGRQPTYLLLRTSQEKAGRFFGGARFWQIPGDFLDRTTRSRRCCSGRWPSSDCRPKA